ncbi:hypothetical protein GCM10028777_07340 [Angustibacter speluncae]
MVAHSATSARQDDVNPGRGAVKEASRTTGARTRREWTGAMTDLLFVALVLAVFVALALLVRGLDRP